ncbi:cupin domain-containing protein [Streptomyces xinghaiensis]|uniref:FlF4, truncated DNA-binding protein n=1 Tax=Streptomyces xinghaiensis TaxID=1038928 RepID=A0A068VNE1_9ACTN|nr:cupin domain-containing protein [Streptomyces xinghaiensis]CDP39159.1 FlF4, truncated DNA-binding protein [Streptomyces xinghaiensis]
MICSSTSCRRDRCCGTVRPPRRRASRNSWSGSAPGGFSEIWRIRIAGAGHRIDSPAHAQGTIERIVVLSGGLRAGPVDAPVDLAEGDFVTFAADVAHFYQALRPGVDAVLVMTYPAAS